MNGAKEAASYAKQRDEKEGDGKSYELATRTCCGARSSDLRELLSGISINGCLHCADRSYDDVLNGPYNVYIDVDAGKVIRIKRDSFRRDEIFLGSLYTLGM